MNARTLLAADPTLADFGKDPIWISIIKAVVIFIVLMLGVLFGVWFERKLISRMQNRYGPNRAGKFGLLQSVADGIKMGLKEDLMPRTVDKVIYFIAPVVLAVPAFLAFSVIPMGPMVSMFGVKTPLQLTDLPVAVLLGAGDGLDQRVRHRARRLGIAVPVLDARRSAGQRPGGLLRDRDGPVVRGRVPVRGDALHLGDRQRAGFGRGVHAVRPHIPMPSWYMILLIPSFLIYIITMLGETNRVPFDLPEGEGELVGGFQTEYSTR